MQLASEALLDEVSEQNGVERREPGALCAYDDERPFVQFDRSVKVLRPKSVQAALRLLTSEIYDVRCAIVRPEFHRGGGVHLVARLRELRPLLPVMLQVEKADRNLLSLAYFQGLELAVGAGQPDRIKGFVNSSLARPRTTVERLESRVAHLARRHALTPREVRIADAVVRGMSRAELLASFEVSTNTLKSQTRSILQKTGHSSLNELCRAVLTGLFADAT